MKQKYQVFEWLQNYLTDIHPELENIVIKRIGSKKFTYNYGDPINNVYFILQGDVKIGFATKQAIIPPGNIVGDYELINKINRRSTSLKACTKAQIAILPMSYFYKIKPQKLGDYKFISLNLQTQNQQIRYIASKCFQLHYKFKGDEILVEHEDQNNDFIMIKSGIFLVKKYIGIGIVQKYRIEVEKQFALTQLGEGQIISQNIMCNSPKGEVYICKNYYMKMLLEQFQELQTLLKSSNEMKQSHLQRQKSIKKLCVPNSELVASILPPVFHSPRMNKNFLKVLMKHKKILKTQSPQRQPTQFLKNQYLYQINRSPTNQLTTQQTNSNLSLIPLVKLRRPSLPMPIKNSKQKILAKFFKNILQKPKSLRVQTQKVQHIEQDEQIPQIFSSRFQKKMFLRPGNPFRHFKSKSIALDEFNNNKNGEIIHKSDSACLASNKPKSIKPLLKIFPEK